MAPERDLAIFVSCGQSTPTERALGKAIANLVEKETGCYAYFAENQTNLQGVTENILKRLEDVVAFIAVMHPRGLVHNPELPNEPSWVRGSVWIEQEIGIAAFISQALGRSLAVRVYVHNSIRLEGLRDKLHLNPPRFEHDSEILEDLKQFLPTLRGLAQIRPRVGLSLSASITHRRVAVPGGGDDQRYELGISIENDGEEDARDWQLVVDFPSAFLDEGGHVYRKQSVKPGFERFVVTNIDRRVDHVYPGDSTGDVLNFHYALRRQMVLVRPEQLQEEVTVTVNSGNMKARRTTKTMSELVDFPTT